MPQNQPFLERQVKGLQPRPPVPRFFDKKFFLIARGDVALERLWLYTWSYD